MCGLFFPESKTACRQQHEIYEDNVFIFFLAEVYENYVFLLLVFF